MTEVWVGPTIVLNSVRCNCTPPNHPPLRIYEEAADFLRELSARAGIVIPPNLVVGTWWCYRCKATVGITAHAMRLSDPLRE